MSQYIPYSIRNNITDPELAGLLDYLEREMGWDIDLYVKGSFVSIEWNRIHKCDAIHISDTTDYFFEDDDTDREEQPFSDMDNKLFFRTYKTLLPVIRDLYSKG